MEFVTQMWFESMDAIKEFAGEDYETAVILVEDKTLLKRFDSKSQHYTLSESLNY